MYSAQRGSTGLWVLLVIVILGTLSYYVYRNLPTFVSIDQQIKSDQQKTDAYDRQVEGYMNK